MKRAVLATVLAAAACAPASAHRAPGVAPAVHWPAAVKADVPQTETNLEHDSGLNWVPLYRDPAGRTVFGTVGASSTQADKAHAWLCGTEWGRDAVRMWASGGGKGCFTQPTGPVASTPSGGAFRVRETGAASTYDGRHTLAWSEYPGVGFRSSIGCAHKTLPKKTVVTVRYKGKTTTCVIDDRGPYVGGRIIDLQAKQFAELAPLSAGVISGVELSW